MKPREKLLAAAVAALIGLMFLNSLFDRLGQQITLRTSTLRGLQQNLSDLEMTEHQGKWAMDRLSEWRTRSLPYDPDEPGIASSLYQAWLADEMQTAALSDISFGPGTTLDANANGTTLNYRVTAAGSLADLVKFLDAFYRAPFLHQIDTLSAVPSSGGKELKLTFGIRALALRDADLSDELPAGESPLLAKESVKDYLETIVGRDMFQAYRPPPEPRPEPVVRATRERPKPKPFDDATKAQITGIVENRGQLQVWILVRTTGDRLALHAGENFKVGLMEGKVVAIRPREITIEVGGEQLDVELGGFLRAG